MHLGGLLGIGLTVACVIVAAFVVALALGIYDEFSNDE